MKKQTNAKNDYRTELIKFYEGIIIGTLIGFACFGIPTLMFGGHLCFK